MAAELITDCPRCNVSRITFRVLYSIPIEKPATQRSTYEVYCACRHCLKSTTFVLIRNTWMQGLAGNNSPHDINGVINAYYDINNVVRILGESMETPESLPANIHAAFQEGTKCLAIDCYNAAAAMFRLSLDITTRNLLPDEGVSVTGLTRDIRNKLSLRLKWLFDNNKLPDDLKSLAACVKNDGNDGVHDGNLQKIDAEDLQDFTYELLERIYTKPARVKEAENRRATRRANK